MSLPLRTGGVRAIRREVEATARATHPGGLTSVRSFKGAQRRDPLVIAKSLVA